MKSSYIRLIDANLNRSREGLRVCEDVSRFILNDRAMTRSFKSLRHKLKEIYGFCERDYDLFSARDVKKDIGKKTHKTEAARRNVSDIFAANIQRVKESLRVLEESFKLIDAKLSERFKKIRFNVYGLETKSLKKIKALREK